MDRMQPISTRVLTYIHEGMAVHDLQDHRIGTVSDVFMGEAIETNDERGTGPASVDTPPDEPNTLVRDIAQALVPGDTLPETVRARLLRSGYIRINRGGILPGHSYATPEQIAKVSENKVHLSVNADELIRPSTGDSDEAVR